MSEAPVPNTITTGHVLSVLATWPDECVQCVVTSPPYWGLRDYGIEPQVWGGEPGCEHDWGTAATGAFCPRCGAWRGSLGLEPTPELYVEHLVSVFREVRRVLRTDGTLWLNLGDSYATGAGSYRNPGSDVEIAHGGKQAFTKDYPRAQPNRMPLLGLSRSRSRSRSRSWSSG